jgi:hypothetical protein
MRRISFALLAVLGIAGTTYCGSGSSVGAVSGGDDTGAGGGGANDAAGEAAFDLELERAPRSGPYASATLDLRRVMVFHDGAPAARETGFACESAGGTAIATAREVALDFSSPGTTQVGKVKVNGGSISEVWLLARADVVKNGRSHAAHGELGCFAADGTLYSVLRLVPAEPIAVSGSGPRLVAAIDPATAIREEGDCDRSCDEDDQHLRNPDPVHGRIWLASELPLRVAGNASPDTAALPPPATPSAGGTPGGTGGAPGGAGGTPSGGSIVCAPGTSCSCEDAASCDLSCPGGNCTLSCERAGTCQFSCTGGGCEVSCEQAGSCVTSCPGNDCRMSCEGAGTCSIAACASGCDLTCSQSGSCG